MICEACKAGGKTSRVFDRGGSTTCAYYQPFYDENGKWHNHDGNVTTTGYECSNGHRWTVESTGSCWCGWPNEQKPSTSINEAIGVGPQTNVGWTIPASMLAPATPPDHYTLDQVRAMLHIALTDRTLEWTMRPLDERIDALLAMFTPKEKP